MPLSFTTAFFEVLLFLPSKMLVLHNILSSILCSYLMLEKHSCRALVSKSIITCLLLDVFFFCKYRLELFLRLSLEWYLYLKQAY